MPYTNGNGKKKKSNGGRKRQKSVITKSSVAKSKRGGSKTKKKKVYFTGSKGGKPTFGTKPNPNIIGSVGKRPTRKKKK